MSCFMHIQEHQRSKIEVRDVKCIFWWYFIGKKGYKCYDITNKKLYLSRDVKFFEDRWYYTQLETNIFTQREKISYILPETIPVGNLDISKEHDSERTILLSSLDQFGN